jgi:hypothetical protein
MIEEVIRKCDFSLEEEIRVDGAITWGEIKEVRKIARQITLA